MTTPTGKPVPYSRATAATAQQAGPTVFAPCGADQAGAPHLGRGGWGIACRVADLDAMGGQLADAGIAVEVDPERHRNGRFAQLIDPEGNGGTWPASGPGVPRRPELADTVRRSVSRRRGRVVGYALAGKIVAIQGEGEQLATHLLEAASALEDVPGCHVYLVNQDPTDADALWVVEVWESAEAHRASLDLDAIQQLISRARPIIASMGDRLELLALGGKGLPPLRVRELRPPRGPDAPRPERPPRVRER